MRLSTLIPAALLSLSPLVLGSPSGILQRGTLDGTCGNNGAGAGKGLSCASTAGNACCSVNGWCGDTAAYCGTGCQPQFGTCTGAAPPPTTPPPAGGGTSTTTCGNQGSGANGGLKCSGTLCCSTNGWCGNTAAYCGTGCQAPFGTCTGGTTTPPPTTPPPAGGGTSTTTCGNQGSGANGGLKCSGTLCCSTNGWCGNTAAYCGTGCQAPFGTCTGGTTTPPPTTPPPAGGGTSVTTCGNQGSGANGGLVCANAMCCSTNGWCGTTAAYCGTGCQAPFGTCTGAGTGTPPPPPPAGGSTANVPRTFLGSVNYGGLGVYDCNVRGLVAMTFDDGPYTSTSQLLDMLDTYGAKATFFVTGNNLGKGAIDDMSLPWAGIIRRMDNSGHQVASHTWTHQDLSTLGEAARRDEMYRLETALVTIIGKFPTYMRPPYSSCDGPSGCQATMSALGYHITYFDLDTDDYNQLNSMQVSRNTVTTALQGKSPASADFLSIAHDIHPETVGQLAGFMMTSFRDAGYRMVTLGECLGDARANWYRTP